MTDTVIFILIEVLALAPAIVLHECAHGFAANCMGDPTAKRAGRLTLNPVKHVDPVGTLLLPALLILSGSGFLFAYAKPVPYNPRNFKNIRRGEFITAFAGPAANIAMALFGAVCVHLFEAAIGISIATDNYQLYEFSYYATYWAYYFVMINLCLAFFNLIPLPPLDGSAIIAPLLSDSALRTYYKIQGYGMAILLIVLFLLPSILGVDLISVYLNATAGSLYDLLLG